VPGQVKDSSRRAGRRVPRRLRAYSGAGNGAGLWPDAVARLYGMPADRDGAGQAVGVITLRGGYLPSDLDAAAAGANRPRAVVVDQSVDGVVNDFGTNPSADEELALDLQVLTTTIPAARIVVYFADNTMDSLANAIRLAVNDQANRPSVLSISWGSAETFWPEAARNAVQAALEEARDRHVTVIAAAGDELATAGVTDDADRRANVGFPGSSPLVLCCGGTHPALSQDGTSVATETVWNEGLVGTGGGISDVFPVPDFQSHVDLPPSVNDGGKRRGVPDVAAAASKSPGYRIVLNGVQMVKDGTSAATPLWAALVIMVNAARGQPIGLINPFLYANPGLFRQILTGNNRVDTIGYDAGPGWNACSGLGVPLAAEIIAAVSAVA
jgi:kumamolisin